MKGQVLYHRGHADVLGMDDGFHRELGMLPKIANSKCQLCECRRGENPLPLEGSFGTFLDTKACYLLTGFSFFTQSGTEQVRLGVEARDPQF